MLQLAFDFELRYDREEVKICTYNIKHYESKNTHYYIAYLFLIRLSGLGALIIIPFYFKQNMRSYTSSLQTRKQPLIRLH